MAGGSEHENYIQELNNRLLALTQESEGSLESIFQEAVDTETILPFANMCQSLGLDPWEQQLLLVLWQQTRSGRPGMELEQALSQLPPRQETWPLTPLAPCFQLEADRVRLSPVTLAYLEGQRPTCPRGTELKLPVTEKCYGQDALELGRRLLEQQEPGKAAAWILTGEPGSGRHFVAEQLAAEYQSSLLWIWGQPENYTEREFNELLLCVELYQALVCVDIDKQVPERFLKELSDYVPFVILIQDSQHGLWQDVGYVAFSQTLELPDSQEKRDILEDLLGAYQEKLPLGTMETLAARQLPRGAFLRYIQGIRGRLELDALDLRENLDPPESLHLNLMPANRTMEELKLPEIQKQQLEKICQIVAARRRVLREWGFGEKYSYGNGISILFYGAPGTGKTMAAQVMANTLRLPLLRVDLSQLISKYIGETQKNIGQIFDQAAKCDCVLLFDEADAIFAQRSQVSDAQDRYSNAETAYLLQRIEQYQGVSVLATNLLQNFDEAFRRRITYMLHFPMPDEGLRRQLWESVLPPETQTAEDLDYLALAQAFQLSGASIRGAAFHGACSAMAEGTPLHMRHLLDGILNEYEKNGKKFSDTQQELLRCYST